MIKSIYSDKLLRDPFITPFNVIKPKPKIIKKKVQSRPEKKKKIPKLKLLGTLNDQDGPMAIIQFPDHSTHFVREKQKIESFIIEYIDNKKVRYKYKDQSLEMSLE